MFADTPTEAFNINSLFVDSRSLVERSNGPMNHVISKKECQELYPHHDGVDGESFYGLIVQFRNRHFVEKLISSCNCDFSLAQQIGPLCHGNIYVLDRLCALFSNDLSLALRFLNCFPSLPSSSSPILLSSQFLSHFNSNDSSASFFLSHFKDDISSAISFLSHFNNDVSSASTFLFRFNNNSSSASSFLSHFNNDGSSASSFLSHFNNGSSASSFLSRFNNDGSSASSFLSHFNIDISSANSFLSRFNNDGSSASSFLSRFNNNVSEAKQAHEQIAKFSEESSFDLALCGCNGDISAVEAFSTLSRIKHLELLYDSELHPRTAEEFHSRCDARSPTVSFICANGNCVGVVKSSSVSPFDECQFVFDSYVFLLRLSPNPRRIHFKNNENHFGLYRHSFFEPVKTTTFLFGTNDLRIDFSTDEKYPKGMFGSTSVGGTYDIPVNDFLFPTTDGTSYPIDRIVVCKFIQ